MLDRHTSVVGQPDIHRWWQVRQDTDAELLATSVSECCEETGGRPQRNRSVLHRPYHIKTTIM